MQPRGLSPKPPVIGKRSASDNQAQAVFIPLLKAIKKDRTALPKDREFFPIKFDISLFEVIRGRTLALRGEHSLLLNHEADGKSVYGAEQHNRLSNRKSGSY